MSVRSEQKKYDEESGRNPQGLEVFSAQRGLRHYTETILEHA